MTTPPRTIAAPNVPAVDLGSELAEQRHQVADLDSDSRHLMPGCIPAFTPIVRDGGERDA